MSAVGCTCVAVTGAKKKGKSSDVLYERATLRKDINRVEATKCDCGTVFYVCAVVSNRGDVCGQSSTAMPSQGQKKGQGSDVPYKKAYKLLRSIGYHRGGNEPRAVCSYAEDGIQPTGSSVCACGIRFFIYCIIVCLEGGQESALIRVARWRPGVF